jgi:threonine aldolase
MVFHFIPWFQKYNQPSGPIGLSDAVIVTESGGIRCGSMPMTMTVVRGDGSAWDHPRVVEMRSDTMTMPTLEMKAAMVAAELGDDVFGEDPTINELQHQAAQMFGKEAALFVPTGTMGNLASLMAHCDTRGSEIILGSRSHVHFWEQGGISTLASIHSRVIPQSADGTLDLEEVEEAVRGLNDHWPTSKVLVLEQTHNMCGGRVLPLEYMDRAGELCRRLGLKLHIDGARIFSACAALDATPERMLLNADSASVCLSKGLASPVGSLIIGSAEFILKARRARKVLGGGMRQAGVLAACGLVSLDRMSKPSRLKEDHRRTKDLAAALSKLPGLEVSMDKVESNIVMIDVKDPVANALAEKLGELGTKVLASSKHRIRAVVHYQIDDCQIAKAIRDFTTALEGIQERNGTACETSSKRARQF